MSDLDAFTVATHPNRCHKITNWRRSPL